MGVRVKLICNAASGNGTDAGSLTRSLERLGAAVGDEAPERVIAAGGDGTLGQAAAEASALGVPLGVVPTGTANDFARSAGLPVELEDALRIAATGSRTRSLELGDVEGRPFLNAASAGLAPSAARRAEPFKRFLGPLAYIVGAIAAGARERPIRCKVGDIFEGEAWQVIVACTGAFGGGSEIEAADPQDGLLDVVVLPAGPRLALARHALAMRRGNLVELPGVVHRRVATLTMTVPEDTRVNVDGEVETFGGDIRFGARADAVRLVVG